MDGISKAAASRPDAHPARRVVVSVDGSAGSAGAFRRAASQARQRNALLDVVCVLPDQADARAAITARVMLGEFTRRECPYGVGAPMRFRIERGDLTVVLLRVSADAELLVCDREDLLSPGPDTSPRVTGSRTAPAAITAPARHGHLWLPRPFGAHAA